jgi:hypothetical protein
MDDEPRSADARILRPARHQLRLLSGLSARRRRAALSRVSGKLEARRLAAQAQHRLHLDLYVDETDQKALDIALFRASRAYEGFLAPAKTGESFEARVAAFAKTFVGRGEPGASEIMANVFNPDYLLKHDLVFIGSPQTVAAKSALPRKRACSTPSWASSISPICRRPI